MESAKKKIKSTVQIYIRFDNDEYHLLLNALEMKRKMIREGYEPTQGADMMPMYEMSETLQGMLIRALDMEEQTWWKSREGGRWFIKRFPQFSLM